LSFVLIPTKVKQPKLENKKIGILGYLRGFLPVLDYQTIRESFPDTILEDATTVLSETMNEVSRASEEELAFLKKGCKILDQSYKAVAEALKPG
jgi:hypothetical protein